MVGITPSCRRDAMTEHTETAPIVPLLRRRRAGRRAASLTCLAAAACLGGMALTGESGREEATIVAADVHRLDPYGITAASTLDPGERLIAELNCIACHLTERAVAERLWSRQAPLLGQVGRRLTPEHLRAWLSDPHAVKPGTTMPQLFAGLDPATLERVVEPLTHFLVSLGGPAAAPETEFDATDVNHGRVLYHQVGCVACHEPLEAPAVLAPLRQGAEDDPYGAAAGPSTEIPEGAKEHVSPIGPLAGRTNIQSLAEFLRDPASIRPSGRMPSMNLTADEARAIATYLIAADHERLSKTGAKAPAAPAFQIDADKAAMGEKFFAAMGCAHCHEMGPNRTRIEPMGRPIPIPTLMQLRPDVKAGCIGEQPPTGAANYRLNAAQRDLIRATLRFPDKLRQPLTTQQSVHRTLSALNCYACHERDGEGGVSAAKREYFTTLDEAELGDEGRIPPPLTGVGGKLLTGWMRQVITTGAKVRPYMATRMPAFNIPHVESLLTTLESVDAPCPAEQLPPAPFNEVLAADGRRLVGAGQGMACISCHSIKGSTPTGEPAMDLVSSHERLRSDWFRTYMRDPASLRPGTRMPNHWPADQPNPFPQIQEGDPARQVDAIWAYLSQGQFLAMPEGVPTEEGFEILVRDEPVVFRTFVKGAGSRAIAIGFPEQVHCVFSAEQVYLVEAWRGAFLSAAGAWAGRGGSPTDPLGESVVKMPARFPFIAVASGGEIDAIQPQPRFRGYRFDAQRRPIIEYDFARWFIDEQPLPIVRQEGPGLRRVFRLRADADFPPQASLRFVAAEGGLIVPGGVNQYTIDGKITCVLRLPQGATASVKRISGLSQLVIDLAPSMTGETQFEVEVTW